jgi:hypothetical protein
MEPISFISNTFTINDLSFITERVLEKNEHFELKGGEIKQGEDKIPNNSIRALQKRASKCFTKGVNSRILNLLEERKDLFFLLSLDQLRNLQINLKLQIETKTTDINKKERAGTLQKRISEILGTLLLKQPKILVQMAIDLVQQIIQKIQEGQGRIDSSWLLRFGGVAPNLEPFLQYGIEGVKDYDVFKLYDILRKILKELPPETKQDFLLLKQASSVKETLSQIHKLSDLNQTFAISLIFLLHEAFEKIWIPGDQARKEFNKESTLHKMLKCPLYITELLCPSQCEQVGGLFYEVANPIYLAEILNNYGEYQAELTNGKMIFSD